MSSRLFYTRETIHEPIEELSLVTLTRAIVEPETKRALPVGARGTVVGVLGGGEAYVVEFTEPFAALVDVVADGLAAVPGESRADLVARSLACRTS